MHENFLDIIIPAYNVAEDITKCILSLENQKNIFDEIQYTIIVVNDGSSDNTKEKIEELRKTYSNIKVITQKNGGVSSARNTGIENATAKYVAFVDADDTVSASYISTIYNNIGSYDWLIFGYKYVDCNNKCIDINPKECDTLEKIYESYLFNSPWNKVYKRDLVRNEFDLKLQMGEDFLFNIEYSKNIKNFKYINIPLYNYIVRYGSAVTSYRRIYIDNYVCLLHIALNSNILDKDEISLRFANSIFNSVCNMLDSNVQNKSKELDYIIQRVAALRLEVQINSYSTLVYKMISNGKRKIAYSLISFYLLARKMKRFIKKAQNKSNI